MPPIMIRTALSEPRSTVEAAGGQPRRRHRDGHPDRHDAEQQPGDEVGQQLRADHGPAAGHGQERRRRGEVPVFTGDPDDAEHRGDEHGEADHAVEHRLDRHSGVGGLAERGHQAGDQQGQAELEEEHPEPDLGGQQLARLGAQGDGHRAPPGVIWTCWAGAIPGCPGGAPGTPPGADPAVLGLELPLGELEEQLLEVGPLGAQLVQLDAGLERRVPDRGGVATLHPQLVLAAAASRSRRPRPARRRACPASASGPRR